MDQSVSQSGSQSGYSYLSCDLLEAAQPTLVPQQRFVLPLACVRDHVRCLLQQPEVRHRSQSGMDTHAGNRRVGMQAGEQTAFGGA